MTEKELSEIEKWNRIHGLVTPAYNLVSALCAELRTARAIITDLTYEESSWVELKQNAEAFLKGEKG